MAPKPCIALLLSFTVVFAGLRCVNWNSRKPFLRVLYSIHVGMTRVQVDAIMGKYLKGTDWPVNPFAASWADLLTRRRCRARAQRSA